MYRVLVLNLDETKIRHASAARDPRPDQHVHVILEKLWNAQLRCQLKLSWKLCFRPTLRVSCHTDRNRNSTRNNQAWGFDEPLARLRDVLGMMMISASQD